MKSHFTFLRYYPYKILLLLLFLLCIIPNISFSQESTWNAVKNDEDWEVFAYKTPSIKRRIALSLDRLQKALEHSEIQPEASLPITKITGITFDDSGDIIILGVEEYGNGFVNLVPDDIVLAMRSMLISDQPPGMSIDPIFTDRNKSSMGPYQDVVYFGGIEDTRAGLFAFNCDYWMKQLGAGKENVRLKDFSRYADLLKENIKRNTTLNINKGNRFWFYPKESQFVVSPEYNTMLLNKSGVEVLTEEQHNLFEDKLFGHLYSSKKIDPIAKEFADQFTVRYGELSPVYPDLAKLRNFFALCEIFKWAEKRGIELRLWKYLLYEYYPVQIHTPSKAKTVKVMLFSLGTHGLFLVGGVQGEIRLPAQPIIDKIGRLLALRKTILSTKHSSDAIYWEYFFEAKSYASSPVIETRLKDLKKAARNLGDGLIIDLFVEEKDAVYVTMVSDRGNVHRIDQENAKELRSLFSTTVKTRGKLGRRLLERWERFYNTHLKPLKKPDYWDSPDGKRIRLKPVLIIRSNEVNYKYSNLEKVPALTDNFIIFIASKPREAKRVAETSAKELVTKINNIPRLSKENVVFAIRPPRMKKEMQKQWEETVSELERVVGRENVLFNPSKQDFNRMLNNRKKEIIVIELTHTEKGITLRGNERYASRDVLKCGDLSHIKYLITGPGTCSLPRLENGKLAAVLRQKGVGIMNTSYGEVSGETALKRLKKLIHILENIDECDLPAYYLPDIIDQLIGIDREQKGTTNLGKLDNHKRACLG